MIGENCAVIPVVIKLLEDAVKETYPGATEIMAVMNLSGPILVVRCRWVHANTVLVVDRAMSTKRDGDVQFGFEELLRVIRTRKAQ